MTAQANYSNKHLGRLDSLFSDDDYVQSVLKLLGRFYDSIDSDTARRVSETLGPAKP